jgi:hypothetical protein
LGEGIQDVIVVAGGEGLGLGDQAAAGGAIADAKPALPQPVRQGPADPGNGKRRRVADRWDGNGGAQPVGGGPRRLVDHRRRADHRVPMC